MPFPIAILAGGAALQPASVAFFFEALAALGVTKLGVDAYNGFSSNEEVLPTFTDETTIMTNQVHADVGALVSATAERIAQDAQQSHEESVRMDAVLTSAEGHTRSLGECVLAASSQEAPNNEAIHAVTVNLEQQKLDIRVMAESLKNLPELLKARRDQKALLIENKQLKSTIEALEGKVSELTSLL